MESLQTRIDAWRGRAKELRSIADMTRHAGARATMFDLADQYEELAARAERSAVAERGLPPLPPGTIKIVKDQ
jgi:hypothetical protein